MTEETEPASPGAFQLLHFKWEHARSRASWFSCTVSVKPHSDPEKWVLLPAPFYR